MMDDFGNFGLSGPVPVKPSAVIEGQPERKFSPADSGLCLALRAERAWAIYRKRFDKEFLEALKIEAMP